MRHAAAELDETEDWGSSQEAQVLDSCLPQFECGLHGLSEFLPAGTFPVAWCPISMSDDSPAGAIGAFGSNSVQESSLRSVVEIMVGLMVGLTSSYCGLASRPLFRSLSVPAKTDQFFSVRPGIVLIVFRCLETGVMIHTAPCRELAVVQQSNGSKQVVCVYSALYLTPEKHGINVGPPEKPAK